MSSSATLESKIARLKEGTHSGSKPLSALTAYDYPTARLLDEAGVDVLLVGDSLGMVVLGYPDTTHVTMDHMIHHTSAAARGCEKALLIGDLPFASYPDPETTLKNARLLCEAGADAVKLEGGEKHADSVKILIEHEIPVVGHLGMLPQSVLEEGGYKKKGKSTEQREFLLSEANCLADLGICALVLESVVPETSILLSKAMAKREIPTIGIGCGHGNTHGEIAVISDLLGSYPWFVPPFATPRADFAAETIKAAQGYCEAISPFQPLP